jgi:hypothetical protein
MSQQERRRHPRVTVDLPLNLTFREETVETRIRDLSTTGIRFRAPSPLPLMSRVQIGLELPAAGRTGPGAPIAITGVVVRCDEEPAGEDPRSGSSTYDTAIYFEDLSEAARVQLSQFVTGRAQQ